MLTRTQLRKFEEHYTIETKAVNVVEYGVVEKGSFFTDPDCFYNTYSTPNFITEDTDYSQIALSYSISPVKSTAFRNEEFMSHEMLIEEVERIVKELEEEYPSPTLTETDTLFAFVKNNSSTGETTAEFFAVNQDDPTQVINLTKNVAYDLNDTSKLFYNSFYERFILSSDDTTLSESDLKALTANLEAPYNQLDKLVVIEENDVRNAETDVLKAIKYESNQIVF